jgi:hypothetical protein
LHLIEPRNEAEFVNELRDWFLSNNPERSYFEKVVSVSGQPDLLFGMVDKQGKKIEFKAEAKYSRHPVKELRSVWNMLRRNQQVVLPKMAAAGMNIYVILCIGGRWAQWFHLNPERCSVVNKGEAEPWTCMYERYVSKRTPTGKWQMCAPEDSALV